MRARLAITLCTFVLLLSLAVAASAAPVIVDAEKAKIKALRVGRDAVEGIWAVSQSWDPVPEQARRYRIAIVKNNHGVFKDAAYLGVVLCNKEGCRPGEVKLLLTPGRRPNVFRATWRTGKGDVKGEAILEADDNGAQDSAIDLHDLKYDGNVLNTWIVRIPENR